MEPGWRDKRIAANLEVSIPYGKWNLAVATKKAESASFQYPMGNGTLMYGAWESPPWGRFNTLWEMEPTTFC